jgi:hypothetical protein
MSQPITEDSSMPPRHSQAGFASTNTLPRARNRIGTLLSKPPATSTAIGAGFLRVIYARQLEWTPSERLHSGFSHRPVILQSTRTIAASGLVRRVGPRGPRVGPVG